MLWKEQEMRELYIIGAGGFGREVEWLVHCINGITDFNNQNEVRAKLKDRYSVLAFVDQLLGNPGYDGPAIRPKLPMIGSPEFIEQIKKKPLFVAIAIGDPIIRHGVFSGLPPTNINFPSLVHPSVKYDKREERVLIGKGTIICSSANLTTDICIGDFVHINLDCTVGHDAKIGDFCTLSPGVHISGRVEIGERVFLGTGAVVLPNIKIGQGSIVGAGAVVTKDVTPGTTVVGVPAREK